MVRKQEFYGWKLVGALWLLQLLNMGFPLYGGSIINTYMLRDIKMSAGTYGAAFTLLNIFAGVPSIVIAAAIVRYGVKATFLIGSALIFLGALWMAFAASQPWHYVLGFGWTFAALNTAIGNFYGPAAFPKLMGMMLVLSAIACCPSGIVGGRIFDLYKSYIPAYELIIAICVASTVTLFFAKMPQPKNAHLPAE